MDWRSRMGDWKVKELASLRGRVAGDSLGLKVLGRCQVVSESPCADTKF
jgi:hypothetical protein